MCPLLFKILSQLALWSFNISIYRLGISKKLVTSGSQNMGDYSWVTWPYPEKNACFTFCILPVQLQKIPFPSRFRGDSLRWLLVDLPLWKIWLRQLGLLVPNSQYMEKKTCSNHQPVSYWKIPGSLVNQTWLYLSGAIYGARASPGAQKFTAAWHGRAVTSRDCTL